jgi:hypothetical protein
MNIKRIVKRVMASPNPNPNPNHKIHVQFKITFKDK